MLPKDVKELVYFLVGFLLKVQKSGEEVLSPFVVQILVYRLFLSTDNS